ncbi:hypothetical protein HOLleu_18338 [Holothuria leucospilota]|uniref:Uncharacterized protein n=1 Tax=Holothuria leucospilota TaxID=206669 RepID=A0A9Q1C3I9_HOLLE|nr:hypothetical protein HOLleu_18338 [Holothuria leucospilota]
MLPRRRTFDVIICQCLPVIEDKSYVPQNLLFTRRFGNVMEKTNFAQTFVVLRK